MTTPNTESERPTRQDVDDHTPYGFHYGHGRMPAYLKLMWIGYLVLGTWYVTSFLLDAVAQDLGK